MIGKSNLLLMQLSAMGLLTFLRLFNATLMQFITFPQVRSVLPTTFFILRDKRARMRLVDEYSPEANEYQLEIMFTEMPQEDSNAQRVFEHQTSPFTMCLKIRIYITSFLSKKFLQLYPCSCAPTSTIREMQGRIGHSSSVIVDEATLFPETLDNEA